MYLYCYARSSKAKNTGDKLLNQAEGEWIDGIEPFVSNYKASVKRADGAIVLILPQEACIKLLLEELVPADVGYPIINITPDGKYAGILKSSGYNAYQILEKISSITGATKLSSEDDRKDFAPDLMRTVMAYHMKADNEDLLKEISDYIAAGGSVDIYSDLTIDMSEPVLDTLSYKPYIFNPSQKKELAQAYVSACEEDKYVVFITCGILPEVSSKGKVLVLTPRLVVVGLEVSSRADAEYSTKVCHNTLIKYGVNPDSVVTVAVSALAKDSDTVEAIAEDLGCFVTSFDSRLLKAVKVPLNGAFNLDKQGSEFCTAAACLASDNGRIIVRKAGEVNSITMTVAQKRGPVLLTD
ncbi:MAG: cobalamin biosynthesis protein [Saccharofermentans sp.]|nr:cobalamin biosynthesis protein [Saccharofermentans sp.]